VRRRRDRRHYATSTVTKSLDAEFGSIRPHRRRAPVEVQARAKGWETGAPSAITIELTFTLKK
jgi:hypothetical protein